MSPKSFLEDPSSAAQRLRQEFDESFLTPVHEHRPELIRLIQVDVGERTLAMAAADLISLHRIEDLLPLATAMPQLLGLVTVDGRLCPCFSLAALLDCEPGEARWLLLCRTAPVALAVSRVRQQLLIPAESLKAGKALGDSLFLGRVLSHGVDLPVLDLDAVVSRLRQLTGEGGD